VPAIYSMHRGLFKDSVLAAVVVYLRMTCVFMSC
jgi:hypothetical protein